MKGLSGYVRRGESPPLALVGLKAASDGVSKIVTLVIAVVSARVLSSEEFGVLAVAMVTGWLLGVASDAGLPVLLARYMAERERRAEPPAFGPVAGVMRLRAGLAAAASLAAVVAAFVLAPPPLRWAFWLIAISQLLGAVIETLAHAYRGMGRADVESWLVLLFRTTAGVVALTVLAAAPSLRALAVGLAVPPALALAASVLIAKRLTAAQARSSGRDVEVRLSWRSPAFIRDALPVGIGVLISAVYFRSDVFFVEHWHGVEVAGVYNAAFRLVDALRLIPAAMLAVAFPALCNAVGWATLRRVITTLAIGAVVVAAAVAAAAPAILNTLYGPRFVDAAPALRVLAAAIPLLFVNYALTHQVIAWNGQGRFLVITTAALVINIAGNLVVVPTLGMTGAAISTLVTEVVVAAGCLVAMARSSGRAELVPASPAPLAPVNGGPR